MTTPTKPPRRRLRFAGKTIFGGYLVYEAIECSWIAPILYAMFVTNGPFMKAWILFCVAVSLVVPVTIWRKL